ncbi:MAG: prolyl oligopeptidase family serine peptidase [Verrucomicrobia subdivision 3 bacterium]|nr:prolyl oligopeptidase family serine peptidase [Limisphaerales bacterium]
MLCAFPLLEFAISGRYTLRMQRFLALLLGIPLGALAASAPPAGVPISQKDRAELSAAANALKSGIDDYKGGQHQLLPDVIIFYNAVRYALDDQMFYQTKDVDSARKLLALGNERLAQLKLGKHPWTTTIGLVPRGYRSRLDDSVIPYGLEVPANYHPKAHQKWRLDIWLHGRNNTLSEVRFLTDRLYRKSTFAPKDTIVLHPYGRFCNAYKFAGEVDVMEALRHVQLHYGIDRQRISVRGFSMGGAGAWHIGAHHAGHWAAIAPGAGFVETAVYQNIFAKKPAPTWWEQKLWNLYDVPPIAANFANTTTVAYSGEIDKQKQAADLMASAFKREGMELTHLIGPKVGHKYEPKTKLEVARRVDAAANKGAISHARKVRLTTFTLRQNRMKWLSVWGLEQHWKEARVEAEYVDDWQYRVKTQNVTALKLGQLEVPNQGTTNYVIKIDGQTLKTKPKRNAPILLRKFENRWEVVLSLQQNSLVKLPGLQGPIDDAFLDRFLIVKPSGKPMNAVLGKWVDREMNEAITQWHRQFRGNARVISDTHLTQKDFSQNLILWGDPKSNSMIAKIAGHLPIVWTQKGIQLKDKSWPADKFVPVLIYPNPFNLRHYIVINSGFTFSEYGHLSNSMQNAKLPDYAVLDMRVPIAKRIPKGIAHAGFFGERWELTRSEGKD